MQTTLLGSFDELDADTSLLQARAPWPAAIARTDSGSSAQTVAVAAPCYRDRWTPADPASRV
jgi:hypothetical protein